MNIVICGAGLAGLALANRLSVLGHEVVLLERTPGPRSQGYMIDFFGPGYEAVEEMGLLGAVEELAYYVDEASLVDEQGRRRASIDPTQFAEGRLLSIMRPDLERVLRENLPDVVDLRFGARLVDLVELDGGVRVTLEDGTTLDADLLVGADGIHSTVRGLAFGEESRFIRYLGFHTAAFTFDAPLVHREVQGRFCLTDSVDKQFGFYALRNGKVAAFAVHRTPDSALPQDPRAAIRSAYRGLGWVVPEALELCPSAEDVYYDQVAQVELPTWSRGRIVLVGDACYAVSLLAGQGASLGIAGAYVLADHLGRDQPVEAALRAYERSWRPIAEEKQRVARKAARWFLPASTLQLWIRHVTLRLGRLPLFDRLVAGTLAGKSTALITHLGERNRQIAASSRHQA